MRKLKKYYLNLLSPFLLVRQNLKSLFFFEILYRLLAIMVFFPILTWTQRLYLWFNGTALITSSNLFPFLKNPLTWIVFILLVFLMTIFALFERLALIDALHASKCGLRMTTKQIFSSAFDLCAERFRPANWGLLPYVIIVLHFGTMTDISGITSFISIPGFILESFEKHPWQYLLYMAFIVAMLYLFLRWIFTLPVMMEDDTTDFRSARRKSRELTRGKYMFHILFIHLFWYLVSGLLYIIAAVLADTAWYLLALWLTPGKAGGYTAFLTRYFTPTFIIAYIAISWLAGPILLAAFQSAYYRRKEELGMEIKEYTEEPGYLKKYPFLRILVIALAAVCIFFSGPRRFDQVMWMMNTNYGVPLIMAHRGYSAAAPENTLPAFEKAIEEGFTAAELDVQMTKDGVIVVLHDSSLARTAGVDKKIWDVTYDEIKDLDNGSFFSKEYAGTVIPTLDEVIKLCRGDEKLFLNIEIKRTGHDEGITQKVIDLIVENNFMNQCDITSQDYSTIEEVRSLNPDILTAYTSVIGIGNIQDLEAADIISISETFATYDNIRSLHKAGKRVFVWTVNEEETMERLISLNVDAILTNNPGLCKEVTDRYSSNAMNFLQRMRNVFEYL